MVIQKFNKVIRNKWAWGAIAILFCAMFVGADIVGNLVGGGATSVSAGQLGGEDVSLEAFQPYYQDVQINSRNTVERPSQAQMNLRAWEELAAVRTAEAAGVVIGDAQLAQTIEAMFAAQGGFNFDLYRAMLQTNLGLTPEVFEAYLRRQMIVREGLERTLLGTAVWASPMEVNALVGSLTDKFSVRVASFTQNKEDADKVTVDDAALKAWYDKNVDSLALPERIRVSYVKFDATNPEVLAKMTVTEDDLRDYYDANSDQYPSSDTNNVAGVKAFDEVRADIEKKLRQIEAINYFETNLNQRVYGALATTEAQSRLAAIAAADQLTVQTSPYFSLEGRVIEGFMVYPSQVLPGAKNFTEVVAELDPTIEDLRYGIVASDKAVWLIEKAETSPAHTPTFEESKGKIDAAALRDAKADAFKATVEAVKAQGVEAVLATPNVSTNLTFAVCDLKQGAFPNQAAVVRATGKLKKGEISDFTLTGTGRAILVVCDDRTAGDAAQAVLMRTQARDQSTLALYRMISADWKDWNLKRLSLQTTAATSIVEEDSAE